MADIREDVAEEDLLRADLYAMLAQVLSGPPSQDFLNSAAGLAGDASDLGEGINVLAKVASATTPGGAEKE